MNLDRQPPRCAQMGSVLIVSLLILLVMTLIGVTALQTTTLEEKMAGNLRDHDVAFQAAEAALRDAEAFLDAIVSPAAFDGTNGLYGESDIEPDHTDSAGWATSVSRAYTGSISGVTTAPRYYIKYIRNLQVDPGAMNLGGYGTRQAGSVVSVFRVTVRGTGARNTTQVILRNHFGRRF